MRRVFFLGLFACLFVCQASASPELDSVSLNRLQRHFDALDFPGVVSLADSLVEEDSTHPAPWILRGMALLSLERYDDALADASHIIQEWPRLAWGYQIAGTAYYEQFRHAEAESAYTSLLSVLPIEDTLYCDILNTRAITRIYQRKWDAVIEDCNQAIQMCPQKASGYLVNMTQAYYGGGRPDDGLRILERLYASDTVNSYAISHLAFRYGENGRYREALPFCEKAIRLATDERALGYGYSNRAFTRLHLGDLDGAMADVELGIRYCPLNSYVYRNKALILLALHKNEEACAVLEKSQQLGFATTYGDEVSKLQEKHCAAVGK